MVYLFTLVENQNSILIMYYILYILYTNPGLISGGGECRRVEGMANGKRTSSFLNRRYDLLICMTIYFRSKAGYNDLLFACDPKIVPLQNAISMYHTTGEQNMLCVTGLCYERWIAF